MKYEIIFGDEKLFNGAPDDAVIAIKRPFISMVRDEKMYFFSNTHDAILEAGSSFNFNNVILKTNEYAERRIIKEPKRWTWEDKKDGVLPEVGSECKDRSFSFKVINVTDKYVVIEAVSGGDVYSLPIHSFMSSFDPIETPEEKAQREEDEFVDSLKSIDIHDGTVSGFFNQGARAAYRKLKGGE